MHACMQAGAPARRPLMMRSMLELLPRRGTGGGGLTGKGDRSAKTSSRLLPAPPALLACATPDPARRHVQHGGLGLAAVRVCVRASVCMCVRARTRVYAPGNAVGAPQVRPHTHKQMRAHTNAPPPRMDLDRLLEGVMRIGKRPRIPQSTHACSHMHVRVRWWLGARCEGRPAYLIAQVTSAARGGPRKGGAWWLRWMRRAGTGGAGAALLVR